MGHMTIKLDISKAYDRVEWTFLQGIMQKLGFDQRWVQLAMETITTTVLKTGPDRPVRPVQPGTGSQSGPVKSLKTGQ